MEQTIYLIPQDSDQKTRKFESVEAAIKMNPIIVIDEKIEADHKYSYCLYNSKGEPTDFIQLGEWKVKLTRISNTSYYPYIFFNLVDPNGELEKYSPGNKAIWAFEQAVAKLREIQNFNNHDTLRVFESNKQLNAENEKLKNEVEILKADNKGVRAEIEELKQKIIKITADNTQSE